VAKKILFRKVKGRIIPIINGKTFLQPSKARQAAFNKAKEVQDFRKKLKSTKSSFGFGNSTSKTDLGLDFIESKKRGKQAGTQIGAILRLLNKKTRK